MIRELHSVLFADMDKLSKSTEEGPTPMDIDATPKGCLADKVGQLCSKHRDEI